MVVEEHTESQNVLGRSCSMQHGGVAGIYLYTTHQGASSSFLTSAIGMLLFNTITAPSESIRSAMVGLPSAQVMLRYYALGNNSTHLLICTVTKGVDDTGVP